MALKSHPSPTTNLDGHASRGGRTIDPETGFDTWMTKEAMAAGRVD